MSTIYNWFQQIGLLLLMKDKWYYVDNHKAKWLILIASMPHSARYNQGWINYHQYPTVQDFLPRTVSKEKRGVELGQGKGGQSEWNMDINIFHFVGPVGNLYQHEVHSRF